MAKGATDMALAYAMERKTFGKAIAEHQAIQLKLAEMSTRAAAAALLVEQAANKFDGGERCDLEAGQAKFFASEAAVQNSLDAMRVFGGYSYSPDYEIERFYRDAPLLGAPEDQMMVCGMSLGYPQRDALINSYRTQRLEAGDFTRFVDD